MSPSTKSPAVPIRKVILTEDEPFFAAQGFNSFLDATQDEIDPVLCVLAGFAPAGASGCTRLSRTCARPKAFGTEFSDISRKGQPDHQILTGLPTPPLPACPAFAAQNHWRHGARAAASPARRRFC